MNEYQFVLPYPPSVNHYWLRRGSQYFIGKRGTAYRKQVIDIIRTLHLNIGTTARLKIRVIVDMPDRRRRDLDNLMKAVGDSLEHAGFMQDDNQFDDIRIVRGDVIRGGRLGIKITELEAS